MFFAASLIYALIFPLLALLFPIAARSIPLLSNFAVIGFLHAAVYLLLLIALRASHAVWEDVDDRRMVRQVRACLDVRGCQWLNLAGLFIVGIIAALFLVSGLLPFQNWFLCSAVLLGLLDLYRGNSILPYPSELPSARGNLDSVTPLPEDTGRKVQFQWKLWDASHSNSDSLEASFVIREEDYAAARAVERYPVRPLENYVRYPLEQFSASVQQIVAFFREHSERQGFSAMMEMANVICFVRSIRYASDEETRNLPEWANFAVETLYDGAGDCEDHGILAASLLHHLGHSVALFYLDLKECGHIAIGIESPDGGGAFFANGTDGRTYYFVETVPTSSSERVGDLSAEFLTHLKEWKVLPVA